MRGMTWMVSDATKSANPLDELSDEDVFTHFRSQKDNQSFKLLVQRHQTYSYRMAYSLTKKSSLAEEAVQESFLQLLHPNCPFQPIGPGSFKKWFVIVVSNHAKLALRRERGLTKRHRSQGAADVSRFNNDPGNSPAPSKDLELGEANQKLKEELFNLNEEMRVTLALHYGEGMSQVKIGRLLGVSQNVVSRRIAKGVGILRKRMEQNGIVLSVAALNESFHALFTAMQIPESFQNSLLDLPNQPIESISSLENTEADYHGAEASTFSIGTVGSFIAITAVVCGAVFVLPGKNPPKQLQPSSLYHWTFTQPTGGSIENLAKIKGSWVWKEQSDISEAGGVLSFDDQGGFFRIPALKEEHVIVKAKTVSRRGGSINFAWLDSQGQDFPVIFDTYLQGANATPSSIRTELFWVHGHEIVSCFLNNEGDPVLTWKAKYESIPQDAFLQIGFRNADLDELEVYRPSDSEFQNLSTLVANGKVMGFPFSENFDGIKPGPYIHVVGASRRETSESGSGFLAINQPATIRLMPEIKNPPYLIELDFCPRSPGAAIYPLFVLIGNLENSEHSRKKFPPTHTFQTNPYIWGKIKVYCFEDRIIALQNGKVYLHYQISQDGVSQKYFDLNITSGGVDNLSGRNIDREDIPKNVLDELSRVKTRKLKGDRQY